MLIYVWFLVSLSACALAQEILQPPQNRTTFPNETAEFTCVVTGGVIDTWRINGTLLNFLPSEVLEAFEQSSFIENGNRHLTLEFQARVAYNGTRIQCVTAILGVSAVSENAILSIQGPLSEVGNLTACGSNRSLTVNWTAPFSLDVTGIDPDIWYSVIIYNVTDDKRVVVINNLADTAYTFIPNYLSPTHVFNFSIIPVNGVGEGSPSHVKYEGGIMCVIPSPIIDTADAETDTQSVIIALGTTTGVLAVVTCILTAVLIVVFVKYLQRVKFLEEEDVASGNRVKDEEVEFPVTTTSPSVNETPSNNYINVLTTSHAIDVDTKPNSDS